VSVPVNGPWDLMAVVTGSVVTVVCCFIHFVVTVTVTVVCRTVRNALLQNKERGSLFAA
jgi:hypothetical protein